MNIFEALRESHENQRNLSEQLIQTHGLTEERKELFDALKKRTLCSLSCRRPLFIYSFNV